MKPETCDRVIAAMNYIATRRGDGKDLYASVSELMTFLTKLQALLARFESPERMREDLERMDEPSPVVLAMIEGTARHAPTLIHRWVRLRAMLGLKGLPNPKMGRPIAIPFEQRKAVCDEVSRLVRKVGLSERAAIKRVAKQYGVNAQTIRRIWNMRSEYDDPSSEVTLEQAENFVQTIVKEANSSQPPLY